MTTGSIADHAFPDLLDGVAAKKPKKKKKRSPHLVVRKDTRQQEINRSTLKIDRRAERTPGEPRAADPPTTSFYKNQHQQDEQNNQDLLGELLDDNYVNQEHTEITEEESFSGGNNVQEIFEDDYEISRVNQIAWQKSSSPVVSKRDFIEALNCDRSDSDDVDGGSDNIAHRPNTPVKVTSSSVETPDTETSEQPIARDECSDDGTSASSMDVVGEEQESLTCSTVSEDAKDLLERAQDRVAMQNLREQVDSLKATIANKNAEIESLTGQLRQAVATKCDLVIAHNELEKSHENTIKRKENNIKQMKMASICLLENHSAAEKELLNEICQLTEHCKGQEVKHRQELDDWERMHRNEMLEKDFEIAKMCEEIRKNKIEMSRQAALIKKEAGGFAGFFANQ